MFCTSSARLPPNSFLNRPFFESLFWFEHFSLFFVTTAWKAFPFQPGGGGGATRLILPLRYSTASVATEWYFVFSWSSAGQVIISWMRSFLVSHLWAFPLVLAYSLYRCILLPASRFPVIQIVTDIFHRAVHDPWNDSANLHFASTWRDEARVAVAPDVELVLRWQAQEQAPLFWRGNTAITRRTLDVASQHQIWVWRQPFIFCPGYLHGYAVS